MKFKDIKKYTSIGNYQVNQYWPYFEKWLGNHKDILELCPDFQRGHVWNEKQQIAYIEYCLRSGTSGKIIYFNCSSWMNKFDTPLQLVDGLQRVTAVKRFLNNEIKVFGVYYKDFEDSMPYFNGEFIVNINNLQTRAEVLQWYIELNEGGVLHTKEEINKVKKLLKKEK